MGGGLKVPPDLVQAQSLAVRRRRQWEIMPASDLRPADPDALKHILGLREFTLKKGWNRFILAVAAVAGDVDCSLRITERMTVADTVYQFTGERSFLT